MDSQNSQKAFEPLQMEFEDLNDTLENNLSSAILITYYTAACCAKSCRRTDVSLSLNPDGIFVKLFHQDIFF